MSFSIFQCAGDRDGKSLDTTFEQVDDLLQHATCTAEDIMQVVQLMNLSVLPKIMLAVRQKESTLAASLLSEVEDNIVKMKIRVNGMQQRHLEVQHHVQVFVTSAQDNEPIGYNKLAKQEMLASMEGLPDTPRSMSSTEYASSDDGQESSDDEYQSLTDGVTKIPSRFEKVVGPDCTCESMLCREIARLDMSSWEDLDEVTQKLLRMKHHISCLVGCPSKSEKICARVEQRLAEYAGACFVLEDSCKQNIVVRETSMTLVREFSSH